MRGLEDGGGVLIRVIAIDVEAGRFAMVQNVDSRGTGVFALI